MGTLKIFFDQWGGAIVLLLIGAVIALTLALVKLNSKVTQIRLMWRDLLPGVDAENVEALLYEHLRERSAQKQELGDLAQRLGGIENKMKSAKRFVGLSRYDAFNDVGGEQSFSLAVYDEDGNGVVVTSQVGRSTQRIFSKKLVDGKAERGLTDEEQQAIEEAVGGRMKPQIFS